MKKMTSNRTVGVAPLAKLSEVAPSIESNLNNLNGSNPKPIISLKIDGNCEETSLLNECVVDSKYPNNGTKKSEDATVKNSKIPDGGWGWMVVLAALFIALVADGVSFSFGLLHIKFLEEFKASNSVTSWIGSLFMAVPLLTGPVMSALVDKYGCRPMTILGGIISTVGFLFSAFAQSMTVMYLTFGVLAGLGLGLCFVTSVVAIAFWFEKRRNLAVGLGACGTGIGTFVYAPLTTYLLQAYGWRGTVILLAGTFLNLCVCGALMRDPDWIIEEDKLNAKLSKSSKSSTLTISSNNASCSTMDLNEMKKLLESGKDAELVLQSLTASVNDDEKPLQDHHSSVINLPTYLKQNEKVPAEVIEKLISNKRLCNIVLENYPSLLISRSTSVKDLNKLTDYNAIMGRVPVTLSVKVKKADKQESLQHQISIPETGKATKEKLPKPGSKDNGPQTTISFCLPTPKRPSLTNPIHAYFRNMKVSKFGMSHHGTPFNAHKYRIRASSCPNIYKVSVTKLAKTEEEKWYTEVVELFEGMMDFSLFLEFHFFLLSLSTIILFTWFIVPYFYLVEHMTRYGYTETQASFILSIIGISNTVGMVLLGWAGDQPWLNVTKTCAVCLIICGISLGGMMLCTTNYILVAMFGALFGLTLASSFSYTPVMIVELVSLEKFTTAYGLSLLSQGIGNLIGPPFAGYLFDLTKSWNQSYYQGAFWIIISGILIGVIPYTKNRKMIGEGPVDKDLDKEEAEEL